MFNPLFIDRETWSHSSKMTYPRSHGELVSCLQGTIGLKVRGDLCHNRDPLGSLPVGSEKRARRRMGTGRTGVWDPGPVPKGGAEVEDRLRLLKIYIDSSSSLGENNPNKLSKDVLDLIPDRKQLGKINKIKLVCF